MANQIILKSSRHTFGKELYAALNQFAQDHKDHDRKTYKALWQKWTENDNIKEWIAAEMEKQPGQDVLDKMYKSSWYYYRKRGEAKQENIEKSPRKEYDAFDQEIIKIIEAHIRTKINASLVVNEDNNTSMSDLTPAKSFEMFCEDHKDLFVEEIMATYGDDEPVSKDDANATVNKFKKAYKNKFYKIRLELTR